MNDTLQIKQKQKKKRSNFFLIYSIAFLICAALCYFWFLINKKTLIINSDGWRQHFTAFVYFGKYGREVIKTLIETHKLMLPQWDFSIGLGSDILTTLHFYVIGDPLDLLSIACPTRYASFLYSFLSLFRMYLAGLTFGAFCHVKKQNNTIGVTVGSLVYVFTLFSAFIVSHHPFFAIPMVYLPLLLLGIEQIIAGKRPYLFVVTVFLAAISNFYFFYMLAAFTAVYTIIQLFVNFRKQPKKGIEIFIKVALNAVLGVILSAVILLPVVMTFIGDGRSTESYVHTWLYDANYYRNFLSSLFTYNSSGYLTQLGYNAIALPAVIVLFFTKDKKYRPLKFIFLGATIMLLLPVFGWALNGFSYMANRWTWAYGMIIGYIVTVTLDKMCTLSKRKGIALIGSIAIYSLIAMLLMNKEKQSIVISVILSALIAIVFIIGSIKPKKTISCALALVLVFASFATNSAYFYSSKGENHIARFVSYGNADKRLNHSAAIKIKNVAKDDKTFYRIAGNKFNYNEGTTSNMNSTSFYWSLQNKNLTQLINETEQPTYTAYMFRGFDGSAAMLNAANVKYFAKSKKGVVPYGFTKLKRNVYQNQNVLPFGYTTDKIIKKSDYEKLSSLEKQQAFLQGVVLENDVKDMNVINPTFTDKSINYTIEGNENAAVEGGKIHAYQDKSSVTIHFDGAQNQETYLRFTLKDYSDYSDYTYFTTHKNDPLKRYSKEAWDSMSKEERNLIKKNSKNFVIPSTLKIRFSAICENSDKYKTNFLTCYSDKYVRYCGAKTYLIPLGYTQQAKKSVKLTFNKRGIYDLENIEILEQPVNNVDEQLNDFKIDTMQNVKISANKITGKINLEKTKALCLSIPYSKGWQAKVDGKEVEILQANTAFSAIILENGSHSIELQYHTPYLKIGAYTSGFGVAIFIIYIAANENIIKRKRKNQ